MEKIGTERPLILFAESQEYDLNKQTELMLSLLDIEIENNKHLLSYLYLKKKSNINAKKNK